MLPTLQFVEAVQPDRAPNPELRQLFRSRYAELLGWALRLTGSDREAAEEAVHDAFVDLACSSVDLQGIANLDGYLYRVLRNLHCSRVRREWRHRCEGLPVLEYDSLHLRMRVSRMDEQLLLQDEILLLCRFLCWRKRVSKSASVLLLRFFLGFLPEEVMRIAGLSRASVDSQIRLARKEARGFLTNPLKVRSLPSPVRLYGSSEPDALLRNLLVLMQEACLGECLSVEEVQRLAVAGRALSTAKLGHVVSCNQCLTGITERLRIASPSERCPLPEDGTERELLRVEQTIRELRGHEPKWLQVVVNGVGGPVWKVPECHVLTVCYPVRFVEIFSEQGLPLFYLDLESDLSCVMAQAKRTVRLGRRKALGVSVERCGRGIQIGISWEAEDSPKAQLLRGHWPDSLWPMALRTVVRAGGKRIPSFLASNFVRSLFRSWAPVLALVWSLVFLSPGIFAFEIHSMVEERPSELRAHRTPIFLAAVELKASATPSDAQPRQLSRQRIGETLLLFLCAGAASGSPLQCTDLPGGRQRFFRRSQLFPSAFGIAADGSPDKSRSEGAVSPQRLGSLPFPDTNYTTTTNRFSTRKLAVCGSSRGDRAPYNISEDKLIRVFLGSAGARKEMSRSDRIFGIAVDRRHHAIRAFSSRKRPLHGCQKVHTISENAVEDTVQYP